MTMRFVHVYAMKPEPDRVRAVAPRHAAYWHGLGLGGYLGGPFDDRSGGLISFEADSREEAEGLIASFFTNSALAFLNPAPATRFVNSFSSLMEKGTL